MSLRAVGAGLALVLLWAVPASAQEPAPPEEAAAAEEAAPPEEAAAAEDAAPAEGDAVEEAAAAEDAAPAEAAAPKASEKAEPAKEGTIEGELARHWSSEREMPVIGGERLYPTAGRMEIEVFGGVLPNDAFNLYFPVGVTAGYHFDPTWGAELTATYVGLKTTSELTDFLVENGAGVREDVDLGDEQIFRADVVAAFSPLYGKWSFQTYKISHFDLFLVLGGGIVVVNEPEFSGDEGENAEQVMAVHPEGIFGAGFRFFSQDWLAIRLDARWFVYPAFDGPAAPAEITLGASFFTPEL